MALSTASGSVPAEHKGLFRAILVGYALDAQAERAVATAAALARESGGALHVVHATSCELEAAPHARPIAEVRKKLESVARQFGAHAHVRSGEPAHVVCEVALEIGADLIVLASSHASGPARSLLASVTIRTLHHTPCPVLVLPSRAEEPCTGS